MRAGLPCVLLFCAPAWADGLKLDVGLGVVDGLIEDIHYSQGRSDPAPNPHARVELCYERRRWSYCYEHISSPLTTHDRGIDAVWVEYRLWE